MRFDWLVSDGALVLVGGLALLLIYEIVAVLTTSVFKLPHPVPTISSIVIPWIKNHKLWSSGIAAVVVGFVVFLILHWRIGQ